MTTSSARPPLPVRYQNANIKDIESPVVKYQILNCQGNDILVGRLKVDTATGSGHAFILRRFDTGAVSLTTMFRAAFPGAPEDAEKREVQWVKDSYDLTGNNGSSRDASITRLAGTWVSPIIALELGEQYSLGQLIHSVVNATPDPAANYRRSGNKGDSKTAAATPPTKPPSSRTQAPPSPAASPNPAKRRKESSPAPAPVVATPVPPPRRSTRTKSPVPKSAPMPSLSSTAKTMSAKKATRRDAVVASSDETAVDEEGDVVEESVGTELREQDLAEQRDMIADLKAQRDKAIAVDAPPKLKRAREEENTNLELNFKEPEVGERVIATNRRISPTQKAAVWGVMAFAFGMTAVYVPNFIYFTLVNVEDRTFLPNLF
ncbi:Apses transcription [Mycena sanguinolenta]|uniref:Apses transcription n=1 Tax=Mycena sanguinolenta TaxID=230812 RepID=A0A8H7DJR9_9AGAR|nr:Apses transcription [Mycena sanguinolenta]